jgi:hypothetical protein
MDSFVHLKKAQNDQVFYEDLAFTLLRSLPLSFHTLVVSFNTCIDQLYMKLICGQLLQEEL